MSIPEQPAAPVGDLAKTLRIELGKRYETRGGEVAQIVWRARNIRLHPFGGPIRIFDYEQGRYVLLRKNWTVDGFLLEPSSQSTYDLVREVSETKQCPLCGGHGVVSDPLNYVDLNWLAKTPSTTPEATEAGLGKSKC